MDRAVDGHRLGVFVRCNNMVGERRLIAGIFLIKVSGGSRDVLQQVIRHINSSLPN